jgi:hypothetical protein
LFLEKVKVLLLEIIGDTYMTNRFEVIRQDNGQRLFYIYDNKLNECYADGYGDTIYFEDYNEAEEQCEILNEEDL